MNVFISFFGRFGGFWVELMVVFGEGVIWEMLFFWCYVGK